MNLPADRFYQGNCNKRINGKVFRYERFSYESANKIYDVDIRNTDGIMSFYTNMAPVDSLTKFHHAIIKHYGIIGLGGF